ncbi:50S ribosomal protein L23 [Candidatus Woesearchaeota archaeon]|jgi:large subunit ribosomal protein L23|nr:50S ribosomal protein L23 [Candidatus Woesearchaeota archaeon]
MAENIEKGTELKSKEQVAIDNFDPYQIIKHPLSTEKAIRQIEFDNKLTFVVHSRATKKDVKKAVEELFKVKVIKINIQNSYTGEKRAYVKLGPESLAADVSADLGLI